MAAPANTKVVHGAEFHAQVTNSGFRELLVPFLRFSMY